ncbi:alpha-N-acetylglucosaminidase [Vibrio sp. DW001]|uniref:alpha-N-acetylglucosaminidase n=1 Tax=Vibrio sp. DW001 TaxID=2912315 RepID=UPI0023B0AD69|nr:alpha-N-acetylglucosaminidase [Vibrio sp. DW001]WED25403.1 alpha-N-acetylglucosaminidase [Vibrio sp. DW001]
MKQIIYVISVLIAVILTPINAQGKPQQQFNSYNIRSQVPITEQLVAANDLIERIVGKIHAKTFEAKIIETENSKDIYSVKQGKNNKIILQGNSGVSIAMALHHYLKNEVNYHYSWNGSNTTLPQKLPEVSRPITKIVEANYRVFFNYVTLSYSTPWWDWQDWQSCIDFLAMNGINMPLSVVGIEAVWYNTLLEMNFNDAEAREFLVGPAFFAWQWMQNIEKHAGPLPKSWIDSHELLGQKILERQRAIGMMPIQQGFSGFVPRAMIKKFPEAAIVKQKSWVGFEGVAQLDPLDPLFQKMGKIFLTQQKNIFGDNHLFAADPFHEGKPPKEGDEYLSNVGAAIHQLFKQHDPESVWLMQAWDIREPIATAVPKKDLVVLDLDGRNRVKNDNFWGFPFIVGSLHNFGGRINLHGDLRLLAQDKFTTIREDAPNAVGSGLFMEGIGQNPVYYDLALQMLTEGNSIEIEYWLKDYTKRRYGKSTVNATKAWKILLNTVYKAGTDGVEKSSMIAARPALDVKKSGPNEGLEIPYEEADLLLAWQLLLADNELLGESDGYRFDVVDIGRQVLSNLSQHYQKRTIESFRAKDKSAFERNSLAFLVLLEDVDQLVATRKEYSLEQWVTKARSWAKNSTEADLYEYNALQLLTLWGGDEEMKIFDYAWREWSGLISLYYAPRWEMFFNFLSDKLENNEQYSDEGLDMVYGREGFRANAFYNSMADWETSWVKKNHTYPKVQNNKEIVESLKFYEKYKNMIK